MVWFRRVGWAFVPISLAGWAVTALAAALCVQVFLAVDARSHSNTDTLYGVFPFWAPAALIWAWIAERASPPRPHA